MVRSVIEHDYHLPIPFFGPFGRLESCARELDRIQRVVPLQPEEKDLLNRLAAEPRSKVVDRQARGGGKTLNPRWGRGTLGVFGGIALSTRHLSMANSGCGTILRMLAVWVTCFPRRWPGTLPKPPVS